MYIQDRKFRGNAYNVEVEGGSRTFFSESEIDPWQSKLIAFAGIAMTIFGSIGLLLERKLSRSERSVPMQQRPSCVVDSTKPGKSGSDPDIAISLQNSSDYPVVSSMLVNQGIDLIKSGLDIPTFVRLPPPEHKM